MSTSSCCLFLGTCVGASFLGSYMALRLGPISVVTPIGSLGTAMTVVYSFWLLGERTRRRAMGGDTGGGAGRGAGLSRHRGGGAKIRLVTWGPVFALIGVFVGSISNAGLKIPIRDGVDSSVTVITQRIFTVAFVALVLVVFSRTRFWRRRRGGDSAHPVRITWKTGWLLGLVGLIDGVSFISFGYGLAHAPAWLIAIVSQSGKVISVVGGGDLLQGTTPPPAVDRRGPGIGRRGDGPGRLTMPAARQKLGNDPGRRD